MIVYTAPFDPITDDELQQLKNYHKQTRKPIALAIVGDGIQSSNHSPKVSYEYLLRLSRNILFALQFLFLIAVRYMYHPV